MPHDETFVDGVWFPSVTTVMGAKPAPWLDAWREKWGALATRKMEAASAIGTEFHRCVEEWLDTGDYSPNSVRVGGMMYSWIRWAEGVDGMIYHTEMKVISRLYKYSGTLDAVGKIGKTRMIIDWKTSTRIYPEMALQLAAYAAAFNEQTGSKIKDGLIVHVSKDKPDYKVTTKAFKLGKRPFAKFLELRDMFDEMRDESASHIQGESADA